MVKDNAVVKVTATAKELNSMIHKRQARLPSVIKLLKGKGSMCIALKKVRSINL